MTPSTQRNPVHCQSASAKPFETPRLCLSELEVASPSLKARPSKRKQLIAVNRAKQEQDSSSNAWVAELIKCSGPNNSYFIYMDEVKLTVIAFWFREGHRVQVLKQRIKSDEIVCLLCSTSLLATSGIRNAILTPTRFYTTLLILFKLNC